MLVRANYNVELMASHIPSRVNDLADAISRGRLSIRFSQVTSAPYHCYQLPLPLLSLLLARHLGLEVVIRSAFSAGLASSTRRSYRSGSKRYLQFCSQASVVPFLVCERSLCWSFIGGQAGLSDGHALLINSSLRPIRFGVG